MKSVSLLVFDPISAYEARLTEGDIHTLRELHELDSTRGVEEQGKLLNSGTMGKRTRVDELDSWD